MVSAGLLRGCSAGTPLMHAADGLGSLRTMIFLQQLVFSQSPNTGLLLITGFFYFCGPSPEVFFLTALTDVFSAAFLLLYYIMNHIHPSICILYFNIFRQQKIVF